MLFLAKHRMSHINSFLHLHWFISTENCVWASCLSHKTWCLWIDVWIHCIPKWRILQIKSITPFIFSHKVYARQNSCVLQCSTLLHCYLLYESRFKGSANVQHYRFEDAIVWERWHYWRSEINVDNRLHTGHQRFLFISPALLQT